MKVEIDFNYIKTILYIEFKVNISMDDREKSENWRDRHIDTNGKETKSPLGKPVGNLLTSILRVLLKYKNCHHTY